MSWIVLDIEQLESRHIICTKVHFYIRLIQFHRPFTRSLVKVGSLISHSCFCEAVFKLNHIIWIKYSRIFRYLIIVRIGLELASLVTYDRHLTSFNGFLKIGNAVWILMIDESSICSVSKRKRSSNMRVISSPSLASYSASGKIVHSIEHSLISEIHIRTKCI